MTSMFDKYDNNIKEEKPRYEYCRRPDRLVGSANAQLIKNIKGDEIGVRAPEGSAFTIYFTFDGIVEDDTLSNLLSEASFGFELLDKKHHVLLTTPVCIYPDDCMASVDLISEYNGEISCGNYYMRLYMIVDGIIYTLFGEEDGVLSIE